MVAVQLVQQRGAVPDGRVRQLDAVGAVARRVPAVRPQLHRVRGQRVVPGKVDRLINTRDGAQELRFVGGSQEIPVRLAAKLGDRVRYNAPVRSVGVRDGAGAG
ncbi:FAD-dependent oxidoreductase [Actinomadura yumaensis]|uniref:FAD-dependent oxidoreductase n=1 Tax=Actinomadura yumaensis TaxID=111807 RepID=UPI00361F4A0B